MKHVIRMFLLLLTILLTCSLCIACSGDRDPAQTTAEGQTKAEAPSEETADTAKTRKPQPRIPLKTQRRKKPERKKKQRTLSLTATVKTSRSSAGKTRKFRLTA